MTLQWTAVAFFLYAEIALNLILCIPFVSAKRYANSCFRGLKVLHGAYFQVFTFPRRVGEAFTAGGQSKKNNKVDYIKCCSHKSQGDKLAIASLERLFNVDKMCYDILTQNKDKKLVF